MARARWRACRNVRWAALATVLLTGIAHADDPDGPDDTRVAPPVEVAPQPPPQPPPLPPELPPPPPPPAIVQPSAEILHLEQSGKAMKAGGAFMLAMGIALELSGLVMSTYSQLADGPCNNRVPCSETDPRPNVLIAGIVSSLSGGGLIYGGLAVMSAGNGRIRRAKLMKLHMSFGTQEVSAQMALTF